MCANMKYFYNPLPKPVLITEQVWGAEVMPIVCIRIMAYNHEKYIKECIEGVLMQKTTFPVRVVIHDDASTDDTPNIIREYEQKHPSLVKVVYQKENTYTKPDKILRRKPLADLMVGKYTAICEGDDYWTDPLKLQKQVDFLEGHPDYSLVVGGFVRKEVETGREQEIIKDIPNSEKKGFDIDLQLSLSGWYTKTLTLMYRKEFFDSKELDKYKYAKDVHLNYILLNRGKGFYFKEIFGVYNVHSGGVFSLIDKTIKINQGFLLYAELKKFNPNDEFLRAKYNKLIQRVLSRETYRSDKRINKWELLIRQLLLTRNYRELKKNIKYVLQAFR